MGAALLRRMHGRKPSCGRPLGDALDRPDRDDTPRLLALAESPTLAVLRIPSAAMGAAAPTWSDSADSGDTIITPLALADTLPCPRLAAEDAPTLRTSPSELAALLRLMRPAGMPPPLPSSAPIHASGSAVRVPESGQTWPPRRPPPEVGPAAPAARPEPPPPRPARPLLRPLPNTWVAAADRGKAAALAAERDAMMPTQLWFGPPAGAARMPARPIRPEGFWARLWRRLGLAAPAGPRGAVLPRRPQRGR